MNILFVVPYVPNLIRVRPYNLIRHLARRGNRLTVLTLWSSEAERQAAEDLREECIEVTALPLPKWRSLANAALALPGRTPLQAVYCWQPALAAQIEAAAWPAGMGGRPAFDVAHVEHLRGARYGLHLLSRSGAGGRAPLPVVWDSVDSITHLFRQSSASSKKIFSRLLTRFELGRTERYEAMLAGKFDRVLVTSQNDRNAFLGLPGINQAGERIHVLPNGVDLEYFTPDESLPRDPNTLVISGKMSYHANVSMVLHFTNHILPLIRARRPEVRLIVVGKDPPSDILALGQDANIEVTGTVDDLRPYLRRAAVAVAPLTYGAGIQNKVLEAMACGTPVVTTPRAVSALNTQPGTDLLIAGSEEEFAQAVCRLLEDSAYRERVGREGRRYVERNHRWTEIAARLEEIYQQTSSLGVKQNLQ